MREGWIYLLNKKVYLQNLPVASLFKSNERVWYTWNSEEGWKKLNRWDLVESIIDDLRGTCKNLVDACEDHNIEEDELDFYELDHIEQNIFLCGWCGWWYESGEDNEFENEIYCNDCYDEVKD